MLTQREFARLVDGPSLEREIDRLTKKGGGWLQAAQILSRRVNGTFDANETNFIKSDVDGQLYPIDLIVWTMPE